ncbi:MAG: hypothetical protein L0H75_10085 [Nitrosospira sp.]|nr:hypothetical protein [Nitrosospira sp.]MDN5936504.1 hypothetical protein [Nitrosospira sp.]
MKLKTIQHSSIKLAGLAAASILFLAANHVNAAAPGYIFHDLGTAGGPFSNAFAINDARQIVGSNSTRDDGEILTVWNGTTMKTGEPNSRGWDINSLGQIAGAVSPSRYGYFHAATWDAATLTRTDLIDFTNDRTSSAYSIARGINDAGQVVGQAKTTDGLAIKPILWNDVTTPTVLNTLGGATGKAFGINNAGFAVGSSFTSGDMASHATRWDVNNGTVTDLGTFADNATDSAALAINATGQIAGWSNTPGDLAQHAAFWEGATAPIDLGTLGGTNSQALALNSDGDIVGWSEIADGTKHATFCTESIDSDPIDHY